MLGDFGPLPRAHPSSVEAEASLVEYISTHQISTTDPNSLSI